MAGVEWTNLQALLKMMAWMLGTTMLPLGAEKGSMFPEELVNQAIKGQDIHLLLWYHLGAPPGRQRVWRGMLECWKEIGTWGDKVAIKASTFFQGNWWDIWSLQLQSPREDHSPPVNFGPFTCPVLKWDISCFFLSPDSLFSSNKTLSYQKVSVANERVFSEASSLPVPMGFGALPRSVPWQGNSIS